MNRLLLLAGCVLSLHAAQAQSDLLVADFEGADYGSWKATGEAFGPGPARGALPNQMPVDGFLGHGLVNSFFHGDDATGTLTSPLFRLERTRLQFLIGAGHHPEKTCMNLRVAGRVVLTATGPNDRPGGSEHLDWSEWDVTEFKGQMAQLEIVDQATGGWGHINVDHIVQTDRPLPQWRTDAQRDFALQKRYLNFPVKRGAPARHVSLLVEQRAVREFEIELADRDPDFWVFADLKAFRGQQATVRVDKLRDDSSALEVIEQADQFRGSESLYQEPLRPQFHFTSQRGWNNDPNGLLYHEGEYHLFYQHNPYGWSWGNMHWGHAVSSDLVHWRELGEALYPDQLGTMFSGSAVSDPLNTAGFARPGETALVCVYTAAGGSSPASKGQRFSQCLAYSTDRGRSWTKYAGNPVLPHIAADNRDPKVIWFEPERKWVMALYLDKSDFALFSSPDLKKWEKLSDLSLPGTSECPEFFPISVDGEPAESRWVFYGGNGRYLVGRFDGRKFSAESGPFSLNAGNCFYASQTFNEIPTNDGRRILIGWGQVNLPEMPFNQMMDFPVELTLRRTEDGLRLFTWPAREISRLHGEAKQFENRPLTQGSNPLATFESELLDITAEMDLGNATLVGLNVRGIEISYDPSKSELACLGKRATLAPVSGRVQLRVLADRASIEIFANDGRVYMPNGVVLDRKKRSLTAFAQGADARIVSLQANTLRSIWPEPDRVQNVERR